VIIKGESGSGCVSVSPSLRLSVSPSLRLPISPSLHLPISPCLNPPSASYAVIREQLTKSSKTTSLKCIAELNIYQSGEILLHGQYVNLINSPPPLKFPIL